MPNSLPQAVKNSRNFEDFKELTVLYAEEDSKSAELVIGYLKEIFRDIFYAKNGEEAFSIFENHKEIIDIVISDMNMCEMGGVELVKKIKIYSPRIKSIFVTEHNDTKMIIEAINVGVEGYIIKPITNEKIDDTLECIKRRIDVEQMYKITNLPNIDKLHATISSTSGYLVVIKLKNYNDLQTVYEKELFVKVIKAVAGFFELYKPPNSKLFQISESKFAIFQANSTSQEAIHLVNLFEVIKEEHEFEIYDEETFRPIFGYGISTGHGEELLQRALIALEDSKESGKIFGIVESVDLEARSQKKRVDAKIINRIKKSLDNNELVVCYQPIFDNRSKKIYSYEALVRLKDGENIVSPDQFLDEAKKIGMLSVITRQIIKKSFELFSKNSLNFSINLSEEDMKSDDIVGYIENRAKYFKIEPNRVSFEVLEEISINENSKVLEMIKSLKDLGFKISIDDFGSKSSNFSRIMLMNADYLKIDGSFVKGVVEDENSYKITSAIANFAKTMDMKVIAEFVHNKEVLDIITDMGIDYSQGFYIGKPKEELLLSEVDIF